MSDQLYFRQLLSGRDFAKGDPVAEQMRNFAYLIGDRTSGEALIVDPAYHPEELVDIVESDGLRVVGAVATHYHFDHVGGSFRGTVSVAGIKELLERHLVPIHVNAHEVPWVEQATGVNADNLVGHDGGSTLKVGAIDVTLIHTPGHTPGSQCLLVDGHLVTGDTLFLEGCGRTDLPGSDPDEMYETLTTRLAPISGDTRIYPGHLYSPESSALMSQVRHDNYVLAPVSKEQWLSAFGG